MPNIDGYIVRRKVNAAIRANKDARAKLRRLLEDNTSHRLSQLQLLYIAQVGDCLAVGLESLTEIQQIVTDQLPALDEETRHKIEAALNGDA